MIGKFTTPSGMVAVHENDGSWTVTLPEGMSPELARMAERILQEGTPSESPAAGNGRGIVSFYAMGFNATCEFPPNDPDDDDE